MSFVHLHCHSEYSLLDGANRIDDLIRRAQELEQPALAITDHGNLHAAWEFQDKARKAAIKPIIGMEAYVAPGDRRAARPDRARGRSRTTTWCSSRATARATGTSSSSRSLGYTEGFYSKPRIDRELLAQYGEGLIVSSACMAGEVATHLMADRPRRRARGGGVVRRAVPRALLPRGAGARSDGQAKLNERIFAPRGGARPARHRHERLALPRAEDHDAHDVLLCIGLGKDRERSRSHALRPRALLQERTARSRSTSRTAPTSSRTRCRSPTMSLSSSRRSIYVPSFPLPTGVTSENELLVKLATAGAKARYGDPLPADVQERLDYELGVITKTGYAGLLPDRRRLHPGGARSRDPGGPGPRLGRRLARRATRSGITDV